LYDPYSCFSHDFQFFDPALAQLQERELAVHKLLAAMLQTSDSMGRILSKNLKLNAKRHSSFPGLESMRFPATRSCPRSLWMVFRPHNSTLIRHSQDGQLRPVGRKYSRKDPARSRAILFCIQEEMETASRYAIRALAL
jgi:hypothetical protein